MYDSTIQSGFLVYGILMFLLSVFYFLIRYRGIVMVKYKRVKMVKPTEGYLVDKCLYLLNFYYQSLLIYYVLNPTSAP